MNYHGKTMLTCYKAIDIIVNQIENVIRSKVRNSFYNFSPMSEQAEKILKLTDIRLDLLELKEITKDALSKLSEYDRTLIYYKYFGIKPKDDSFDLKSRNYFRKQNKALDRFNYILKEKGYNEDWFIKKYFRISFIAGAYQKMISEEGKKHAKY